MKIRNMKHRHLLKSIQKTGVSFFAVAFIAATSMAIFLGMRSSTKALLDQANRYFDSNNLATWQITCANGITERDIDAIRDLDMVSSAEGAFSDTAVMEEDGENISLAVLSLCDSMNLPVILEGKLPQTDTEVAVEQMMAEDLGISTGDTITLENADGLKNEDFLVTAVINQPMYSCSQTIDARGKGEGGLGANEYYVMMARDAFDPDYYRNCFTTAYVDTDETDGIYYFSDAYSKKEAALRKDLESLGKERAQLRYEEMQTDSAIVRAQIDTFLDIMEDHAAGMGEEPESSGSSQVQGIRKRNWIISNRNEMGDLSGVGVAVAPINSMSVTLPLIFLAVAAIVCYAAITRMIDEQRVLIGTQKALGFRPGEILRHYMSYSALCAVLGTLIGWTASVLIVEVIVLWVYSRNLLVGAAPFGFSWGSAVLCAALCFGIFLTATYIACARLLKVPATMLLRGEIPQKEEKYFFRNWKVYRKLSLYSRTMIRNVLGDKGRMFTTISGLTGCVSLLIVVFSLRFGIEKSSVIQFDKYFTYGSRLMINTQEGSEQDFTSFLDESGTDYTLIQDKLEYFRQDGGDWNGTHVIAVRDADAFTNFVRLEDISTGETVEVPDDGILVSRKCAERYGLKKGSTLEIMDSEGNARECKVAGVIEHYLKYHLFVTSEYYWESVMGESGDYSVFLLGGDQTGLRAKAQEIPGFMSLADNSDYDADASFVNAVIYVCIALSVVMVLLVLLNQIVMYINRKSRELIVMRINGYTLKETKAYVSNDNIMLTALGLVFGCVAGIGLAYIIVRASEPGAHRYVRTPNGPACLLSCAIVAAMAVVVNLIALRKVDRLNLTNTGGN